MTRNEELVELQQSGRLLTGISHDLNNAIAGILGYVHLLEREKDDSRRHQYTQHVKRQAEICRVTLDNLQLLGSTIVPRRTRLSVSDLVNSIVCLVSEELRALNIGIVSDLPEGLPPIDADAHLVRRAVNALLSNAQKSITGSGQSGTITVSALTDTHSVVIAVTDSGPGLPEHLDGETVFSATANSKKRGAGIGLGLPMALAIARAHGGDVWLEKSSPVGCSFAVSLPIARLDLD